MKKIALIVGVVGALLIACDVGLNVLAFILMLAQSLFWVKELWKTQREAATLNAVFAIINVVGVVRALL